MMQIKIICNDECISAGFHGHWNEERLSFLINQFLIDNNDAELVKVEFGNSNNMDTGFSFATVYYKPVNPIENQKEEVAEGK